MAHGIHRQPPPPELGHEITFLKGCALLRAIGDRPVTKEVVLEALDMLNDRAMRNLSRAYPTRERRVADFTEYYPGARLYCESRELSVQRVGQTYLSASYDHDIPELSKEDLTGSSPRAPSSTTSTA
eukprot:11003281-Lingulodinium_polyedra.AAC.1